MVEAEAKTAKDRPLIASVIYNRLAHDPAMQLQVDATLDLTRGDAKNRSLSNADKSIPSPYNTYLHFGLPPTPIAAISEASLRAALHPATTDYLFYVVIDKKGNARIREHVGATSGEHRAGATERRAVISASTRVAGIIGDPVRHSLSADPAQCRVRRTRARLGVRRVRGARRWRRWRLRGHARARPWWSLGDDAAQDGRGRRMRRGEPGGRAAAIGEYRDAARRRPPPRRLDRRRGLLAFGHDGTRRRPRRRARSSAQEARHARSRMRSHRAGAARADQRPARRARGECGRARRGWNRRGLGPTQRGCARGRSRRQRHCRSGWPAARQSGASRRRCGPTRSSPISSITRLDTQLLHEARTRGARTVDGLQMLVQQAALQFEQWTGARGAASRRCTTAARAGDRPRTSAQGSHRRASMDGEDSCSPGDAVLQGTFDTLALPEVLGSARAVAEDRHAVAGSRSGDGGDLSRGRAVLRGRSPVI